jgi:hypothetical protein
VVMKMIFMRLQVERDVLECKKFGMVEVVEEEKVGRWKGGLSSRRSEGGCEVIMQFMALEKLTPK